MFWAGRIGPEDGARAVRLFRLVHGEICLMQHRLGVDEPVRTGDRQPDAATRRIASSGERARGFERVDDSKAEPLRVVVVVDQAGRDSDVDPASLTAELAAVRETGVAVVEGTVYPDITCVATPLRADGEIIGAIALSGPSGHMKVDTVVQAIRAASQGICVDYIAHMEPAVTLRR
jgi:hypothetical protein